MTRHEAIAAGLLETRQRIARACADSGRSPDDVTLVVVTKTFPVSDIQILSDLGLSHVAENRAQELRTKASELSDLDLTWHFIGQI